MHQLRREHVRPEWFKSTKLPTNGTSLNTSKKTWHNGDSEESRFNLKVVFKSPPNKNGCKFHTKFQCAEEKSHLRHTYIALVLMGLNSPSRFLSNRKLIKIQIRRQTISPLIKLTILFILQLGCSLCFFVRPGNFAGTRQRNTAVTTQACKK